MWFFARVCIAPAGGTTLLEFIHSLMLGRASPLHLLFSSKKEVRVNRLLKIRGILMKNGMQWHAMA